MNTTNFLLTKEQERLNNMTITTPQWRKISDEFLSWFINNQIILAPERDEIFAKKFSEIIETQIAQAEERMKKKCLECIEHKQKNCQVNDTHYLD